MADRVSIPEECNRIYFEGVKELRAYRYESAEEAFTEAQQCFAATGFPPGVGKALINQARIRRYQGKYQEALNLVRQATKALHDLRGRVDLKDLAMLYSDWGNIHTKLGQKEEAKRCFLRSLGLVESHLARLRSENPDSKMERSEAAENMVEQWDCEAGLAMTLLNLAGIAQNEAYTRTSVEASSWVNPWQRQLELLSHDDYWRIPLALVRRAKDITFRLWQVQSSPETQRQLSAAGIQMVHPQARAAELGSALGHLADIEAYRAKVLWARGLEEDGDRRFNHALSLAQRSLGYHEEGAARSETYFAMRQLFQTKYLRELYKRWKTQEPPERPGDISLEEAFENAPPWLNLRSLDDRVEHDLPLEIPAVEAWQILRSAAFYWSDCGHRDKEYKHLARAAEQIETMQRNIISGQDSDSNREALVTTDHLKRRFLREEMSEVFDSLIHLLLSPYREATGRRDPLSDAFSYCERSKARAFLDLIVMAKPAGYASGAESGNRVARLRGDVLGVEGIQQQLGIHSPDTALIEYHLTNHGGLAIFTLTKDTFEVSSVSEFWRKLLAFDDGKVASTNKIESHVAEELPSDIDKFCRNIADDERVGYAIPLERSISKVKEQAQALYETLVRPTEHVWKQEGGSCIKRLIFVPCGALHQLPFCTLHDGEQFLAERIPVAQVPSASILAQCFAERDLHSRAPSNVRSYLGFANPRPRDSQPHSTEWDEYVDLSDAEDTVKAVCKFFKSHRNSDEQAFDQCDGVLKTREEAKKSRFLGWHNRYTFVDIHSHGDYNKTDPLQSGILFAGDAGEVTWLTSFEILEHVRFSPYLRLLTLGICWGGRTKLETGDEQVGLLRAFFASGARSILTCGWSVDDTASEELIVAFYKSLLGKGVEAQPKDQALQAAQRHVIEEGRRGRRSPSDKQKLPTWEHPYYWAWTLYGDPVDP